MIRTPGILLPKQARYQLRYAPIQFCGLFDLLSSILPKQARYQLRYTPALLFYTLPLRKRSFGYYTILPEIVNHTGSKGRD